MIIHQAGTRLGTVFGTPAYLNRYRHADGHYLWFEWNAQVVAGERAIYAVARDVTERIAKR